MEKKRLLVGIAAAVTGVAVMTAAGTSPENAFAAVTGAAQQAAFLTAGIKPHSAGETSDGGGESDVIPVPDDGADGLRESSFMTTEQGLHESTEVSLSDIVRATADIEDIPDLTETMEASDDSGSADAAQEGGSQEGAPDSMARVISRNITEYSDGLDRTAEGSMSGTVYREHFGGYQGTDYIKLPDGGLVWNCTTDDPQTVLQAAQQLPDLQIKTGTDEPQVLIVHTHTTESYEPYRRSYYDSAFPSRTRDPQYNMISVGEVLSQRLAENGISVLHDGTVHDYPSYTGAYDRSEVTIRAALEEYPSIKVIIDLHRDAISAADGSRTAPVTEINGRSAAQFMIIAGCDDGRFGNMPNYIENLKLACLFQRSAEKLYPGLARPVLFDYRNYNQHISTGSLLIEVGSHANSHDEAVYTGELLGDILSDALGSLS